MGTTVSDLGITLMGAATEGRHLIFNEAISKIVGLVQGGAVAYATAPLTSPAPVNGDVYLVKPTGTGAFVDHDEEVALMYGGSWKFFTPSDGWRIWVTNEALYRRFNGSTWIIDDPDKIHQIITPGDSVSINWSLGSNASLLLNRASTQVSMTGAYKGQRCVLAFLADGTGGRGITWGTGIRGSDDLALPSAGPLANKNDIYGFHYNQDGETKYDLVGKTAGFA